MIVTHNMQQAARVADTTAFMLDGELVEVGADRARSSPTRRHAHRGLRHRASSAEARCRDAPQQLPRRSSQRARGRRRSAALDLVVEQLDRALEALEHQDVELAAMVIADDDRIDGRYLEVHQGVLSLLALQAPVAGDLRLVAALLHVIMHIERMGDQCVNIAKLIPLSGHEPPVREEVLDAAAARWAARARSEVVAGQARVRRARRRRWPRTSSRQDREINRLNREIFQLGDRDRRRPRHARVGDAHDRWSRARSSGSATTPSTSASRPRSS